MALHVNGYWVQGDMGMRQLNVDSKGRAITTQSLRANT
jgi:hypothetical protein